MAPPHICPRPAHPEDCPLYNQRAITADEHLRRLVLAERGRHVSLAALVRAEAERGNQAGALPVEAGPPGLPPPTPSPFTFSRTRSTSVMPNKLSTHLGEHHA